MDYRIDPVRHLSDIHTALAQRDGSYWSFEEVVYTWGRGLKGAKLLKLQTDLCTVYLRARVTTCTIASWQGEASPLTLELVGAALAAEGFKSADWQPLSIDLRYLTGGYNSTVWFSKPDWREGLSRNRRWQLSASLRRYEFTPVPHTDEGALEALGIFQAWLPKAQERQGGGSFGLKSGFGYGIVGAGHYVASIRTHPDIPTSTMFFAKRVGETDNVGLIGGYVRDGRSVVVNMKHDYSDKFLAQALWGFWMDYVHNELKVESNCCGSTSDDIKRRLRMEPRQFYKPPKVKL